MQMKTMNAYAVSTLVLRCFAVGSLSLATCWIPLTYGQDNSVTALGKSLSFHASFDGGPDADFARGDRAIWQAPSIKRRDEATKGLPNGSEVKLEPTSGRYGGPSNSGKAQVQSFFSKPKTTSECPPQTGQEPYRFG